MERYIMVILKIVPLAERKYYQNEYGKQKWMGWEWRGANNDWDVDDYHYEIYDEDENEEGGLIHVVYKNEEINEYMKICPTFEYGKFGERLSFIKSRNLQDNWKIKQLNINRIIKNNKPTSIQTKEQFQKRHFIKKNLSDYF